MGGKVCKVPGLTLAKVQLQNGALMLPSQQIEQALMRMRHGARQRSPMLSADVGPAAAEVAAGEVLVRIRGLRFRRGERVIFAGVDIDIRRGRVTAIMGPSGTGKTTLLKLIGGQLRPLAGSVEVAGVDVHALRRSGLYRLRTRMGMLFQSGALLTDLSVFENVAYPLREHTRLPETMIRKLVLLKLEAVGLRGAQDLMPSELSGGMARRVALARAIALDPMMILYDEPTSGLDPITADTICDLINELSSGDPYDRTGFIIVTHDVADAVKVAERFLYLRDGVILFDGKLEALRSTQDAELKRFIKDIL